ncbi:chloride channel protein [Labilithrix luteola]|uniref:chloride channel protein n=1 Tax=Labilithrix luteola TaxID=1391654 RepID=UPI001969F929|nr:chloride channel protein [Labilithrix luteola]
MEVPLTKRSRLQQLLSTIATSGLSGLVGALVGAGLVIGFTQLLKMSLAVVSSQATWVIIVVPLVGLCLSVLVLYGFGLSENAKPEGKGEEKRAPWASKWRTFVPGVARSDLTGEMVAFAGEEDRFPWRLAPIRAVAIAATVGLGGPLGTEAPAAYLGVAVGSAMGDFSRGWRRWFLRPAAVGGGAAGVSALMGIPLVGTAYVLELGRRHDAPLDAERVTAALVGGVVGWLMNIALHVNLIRLVVPKEPPHSFAQAVMTAVLIGALSGSITSITGAAIYRAKGWNAHPVLRLAIGGLVLCAVTVTIARVASPQAAIGPGGGSILWVENTPTTALTVLGVTVLRAMATTAGAAAGGCGGLFVPFLAVGDLGGRVFAHGFGVPDDLAGSAGAASGIAGGYRLPVTAVTVVLGQGGPHVAMLCCLATVLVATFAGAGVGALLDRFEALGRSYIARRAHQY